MIRVLLASLLLLLAPAAASAQTLLFSPNSLPLSGSCGTVTASSPCIDLTQTWNNAGITFYGFRLNVTDTDSAAASLLMDLQVAGTSKFSVDKSGTVLAASAVSAPDAVRVTSNAGVFTLGSSLDVTLARDAANTLALRRGVNAQTVNIYNTFTDASNYERLFAGFSGTTAFVGTQSAGTGVARPLALQVGGTNWLTISTAGLLQFGGTTSSFPALKRNGAGVDVRLADDSNFAPLAAGSINALDWVKSANYVQTNATTVASLPACAAGTKAARDFVTDATQAFSSANFGVTVTGGGANNVPVVCDGTNWKIG